MNSRGLAAALTIGLLAAGVTGTASADAPIAADDGTVVASIATPGLGARGVTADGRALIAVESTRLTKYKLTSTRITKLGSNHSTPDNRSLDLELHPNSRFAYVTDTDRDTAGSRLQIFDISGNTPRLLRSQGLPELGQVIETTITPDGRRLFVRNDRTIQVLRLGNPAKPTKGPSVSENRLSDGLAITPDGTRLITTPYRTGTHVNNRMRVYDITQRPPAVLVDGAVELAGREDFTQGLGAVVVSPDSSTAYVTTTYYTPGCEGECGHDRDQSKVRLDDLAVLAQTNRLENPMPGGPIGQDYAIALSNNGKRLYAYATYDDGEDYNYPTALVWYDPELSTRNAMIDVGNVQSVSVSPAGPTRGYLYVTAFKAHKHRLLAIRP